MPKTVWEVAEGSSADPQRAAHYAKQLFPHLPENWRKDLTAEQAHVLAALLSGSRALSELLITRPEWIEVVQADHLQSPRQKQGLHREVGSFLEPALKVQDYQGGFAKLRQFRQREMLRIAARDLARIGNVVQIIEEISNVADVCINGVHQICFQQLREKLGTPYTQELTEKWEPSMFCVLGMGKLGGQELNYSSDIDVLFVYSGEGDVFKTPPGKSGKGRRTLSNHQFYARLSEAIIAECTRMTAEGFLFRIDLRLRPEGKSAPLARSLASYETYYAQWGQTWERMMLLKARGVAGDGALASEFLEMVQPFRYPRSISEQIPHEVAEMKERTEKEVVRSGELERNVKLGRGGIREIEFLVQVQQLLHGGRMPFLQNSKTLVALEKLREYDLLEEAEVSRLKTAYCFLRDTEHRLQMEDNRQTHTIPTSRDARTRLARLMGFEKLEPFEKALEEHKTSVRAAYDKLIGNKDDGNASTLPPDVKERADEWKRILQTHSFRDPERCLKLAQEFVHGPGFGHVSRRTEQNAIELLTLFLGMCKEVGSKSSPPEPFLSDPDRVLARLDSYVAHYGARSTLYEAWMGNPSLFRLLLLAFDRSEFLAELAIRDPDLIDQIEQSGQLRRNRTTEQVLNDLRQASPDDDQHQWLRRYYQAEQMRIGLRDILDLADPRQTQIEITALADGFLTYGLEMVMRKHKLTKAPFAIVGLGKLGGRELIYASDLDIVFVAPDESSLPALQKVAIDLMDLLSKRTEQGATFLTDARLRPDGEKGLLVNSLSSYRDYYRKRAMLWEIQSLSRFRPIAGDRKTIDAFSKMALPLLNFSETPGVNAYKPDWKQEIHNMRMRIEKERTPAGKDHLAIKTGRGGLMDVEFVAQTLALKNGWHEPNTLAALARAGTEKNLSMQSAKSLIDNYKKLMEIERILRRWSFEAESVLPVDPAPFYRVSVRCGFQNPEEFQKAVNEYRRVIRSEYERFFLTAEKAKEPRAKKPSARKKPKRS